MLYWAFANVWMLFLAWMWIDAQISLILNTDALGLLTLFAASMIGVNLGLAIRDRYD